jgi:hypothetical protein
MIIRSSWVCNVLETYTNTEVKIHQTVIQFQAREFGDTLVLYVWSEIIPHDGDTVNSVSPK